MTVGQVQAMSNDEWMRWGVFLGRKAQREELAMARARSKRK